MKRIVLISCVSKKGKEKTKDRDNSQWKTELLNRWSDPDSEIVKRMNSFTKKSPDILKPILER